MPLKMPGNIFIIAGPSGSGKTTAAKWLSQWFPAYLEDASRNPYLASLLTKDKEFDALASQRWFLREMTVWLESADNHKPAVLDQAPAAITEVYAAMFREQGLLGDEELALLRGSLTYIDMLLAKWSGGCKGLFFDASEDVLYNRVALRNGIGRTPSMEWFRVVRERFSEVFYGKEGFERIDTSSMSVSEVLRAAEGFVQSHNKLDGI